MSKTTTEDSQTPLMDLLKSITINTIISKTAKPEWVNILTEDVRAASVAFKGNWPDAWLYIGEDPGNSENDWYDWSEPLLGLAVFHCPAFITHAGCDGEQQKILPIWMGDVSNKRTIIREFECRLAKSGDY